MARPRKIEPAPPSGFVASATRLPPVRPNQVRRSDNWQEQGWGYYSSVGELRFVANWTGSVMSRAVLVAAKRDGLEYVPQTQGPAAEAMNEFYGGRDGQVEHLRAAGKHLTIAGEYYVANRAERDYWTTLAAGKVSQSGDRVYVDYGDGKKVLKSANDLIYRAWESHPREPMQPDSPVASSLGTLKSIALMQSHEHSQLTSRLSGPGVMFVPSEVQFPAPEGSDPASNQADLFLQFLAEAMTEAIKDPSSASATAPIVVMVPGEYLDKVHKMSFWTDLDAALITMREAAVKRLALGLDIPPEVLLGLSEANQWSSWATDEASIKAHIEPRLQVVCNAISTAYLQPALQGVVPDPEEYAVLADTTAIRIRPNRSNEAFEMYDRGEITGQALRRETGFHEIDAPDLEGVRMWLLRKIATGSTSPEQTAAALKLLGADLGMIAITDTVNKPPPDDLRTDTTRRRVREPEKRQPDRDRALTRTDTGPDMALLACCETVVLRALERVGNRLCDAKAKENGLGKVSPFMRHTMASGNPDALLAGSWDVAPVLLKSWTDDPASVITVLDMYTRGLLTAKQPHTRGALLTALSTLQVQEVAPTDG